MTDAEPPKSHEPTRDPGPPPPQPTWSMNQIVSYNLWRARKSSPYSQQEVAELLQLYTGRNWSNASVSAAERAWRPGGRPRRFDASEIVAMTKIFDEPVASFFLPPSGSYFSELVGLREFPDNQPNLNQQDSENDWMAVVPTADLMEAVGMHRPSTVFIARMQELCLQFLGMVWEPPNWRMGYRTITSLQDLDGPDPGRGLGATRIGAAPSVSIHPVGDNENVALRVSAETGEKEVVVEVTQEELTEAIKKALRGLTDKVLGEISTPAETKIRPQYDRDSQEEE